MKPKQPHPFTQVTSVNCDYCRGTGKAPSLGLIASVIDLCHHCNGLGLVDSEHGPYHVDIVIQQFQERETKSNRIISGFRKRIQPIDPRCEKNNNGHFGVCRAD